MDLKYSPCSLSTDVAAGLRGATEMRWPLSCGQTSWTIFAVSLFPLVQLPASPWEGEKVSKKEHFMELCCNVSKLWGGRLLAGSRRVLWLATEAVGINEVTVAVRGFAKHWTCSRAGQRKGTSGRLLLDGFFFWDLQHYPQSPEGEPSPAHPLHHEMRS